MELRIVLEHILVVFSNPFHLLVQQPLAVHLTALLLLVLDLKLDLLELLVLGLESLADQAVFDLFSEDLLLIPELQSHLFFFRSDV